MNVTEKEAEHKWCPEVRFVIDADNIGYGAGNSFEGGFKDDKSHCIGSECMMWVWNDGGAVSDQTRSDRHGRCGKVNV